MDDRQQRRAAKRKGKAQGETYADVLAKKKELNSRTPERSDAMKDNIMFYPAVVLMVTEAVALVFLICAWCRDKRRAKDGN